MTLRAHLAWAVGTSAMLLPMAAFAEPPPSAAPPASAAPAAPPPPVAPAAPGAQAAPPGGAYPPPGYPQPGYNWPPEYYQAPRGPYPPGYYPRTGYPAFSPAGERRWYGWQTLITFGASTTLGVVSAPAGSFAPIGVPLGIGGILFGGPIVHWAHGHLARGFAVLGINIGSTLVGGLLGGGIACGAGTCKGGDALPLGFLFGAMIGGAVGATTAVIVDVAVISYDPPATAARGTGPALSLVPILDVGRDRAVFGLGAAF